MDPVEILMHWLAKNYSKLILLAVVLIVAALIDKALTKVVRRVLDKSQVPNASIFVNIMRAVVWVFAIGTLLQPVFGINPTTIFTALGIGGLAVSLGLKDTIANVIGGFGLMLGRVIQPGDYVKVAGITGTVKDINWRQTIVRERNGNEMVIPNSILNTASLEKLDPSNECLVSVAVTEGRCGWGAYEGRHRQHRGTCDRGACQPAIQAGGEAQRLHPVRHRRHDLRVREKRPAAVHDGGCGGAVDRACRLS